MLAAASVTTTTHEAVACGRRFSLSSCKVVVVVVVYSLVLWFKDMSFSLICLIRKKLFLQHLAFSRNLLKFIVFNFFFFVKRYLAFCLFLYLFGKIFFSWKRRRISLFRNSLYNRGSSSSSNCWFPTWRIVRHLALPTERPSLIDKWYL